MQVRKKLLPAYQTKFGGNQANLYQIREATPSSFPQQAKFSSQTWQQICQIIFMQLQLQLAFHSFHLYPIQSHSLACSQTNDRQLFFFRKHHFLYFLYIPPRKTNWRYSQMTEIFISTWRKQVYYSMSSARTRFVGARAISALIPIDQTR